MKYHILLLKTADEQQVRIGRLIAELENDLGEVEVSRFQLRTTDEDEANHIDRTTCHACLMNIPDGESIVISNRAYHRRCIKEG